MFSKKIVLSFFIMFSCLSFKTFGQKAGNFHVIKSFAINGDGGWDYLTVDDETKQLYVSHGDQVNIINEETGDSIGVIKNTLGVHGIALVKKLGKGYISNGRSNTCTVFDLKSKQTLKTINVGANPDAIFYDDFSKKVFVFNGKSSDASVIDPVTDKVISKIALGGKPETGVSDGKGLIFVNIENTNEVVVLNAMSFEIKHRYKVLKGDEPSGLAMDRVTNRLFIGCGGNKTMVIMDASNGKVISSLPIGDCDGVVFDPIYKTAYSSNGDGFITAIFEKDVNHFGLLKNIPTEKGARTIALDFKTHHLFTPTAKIASVVQAGENARPVRKLVPNSFHVLEIGE
nr:YncE family protein [uncultured Pedobacter sp.]